MSTKLQRPAMKLANTKVSETDMIYFSLGIDTSEAFVLPSEREDYRSDARAVQLLKDIAAGKDMSGQDFSGINLKNADISGGKFKGTSFKGALFYKTKATDCDFTDCDFTEAYLEDSDLSRSWFTGASFKKAYLRHLKIDDAVLDEEALARISAMDKLIDLIESGAIDIRSLTQSDLLYLDLRRLDLSKVDLDGMDLSMFILEGVNLRGTHVHPGTLLSFQELQRRYLKVEQLDAKKLKEEVLKVVRQKREELECFARQETEKVKADVVVSKKCQRPPMKQDEFAARQPVRQSKKTEEESDTPIQRVPKTQQGEKVPTRGKQTVKTRKVKIRT